GPVRPAKRPAAPGGRGGRGGAFPPLRGLLPLALGLVVWQLVGSPRSPYFPAPSTWAQGLADLWRAGALRPAASDTLVTLALSVGVATVLGTVLGLAVGASRTADRALNPTLEFARAMPPAAVVPVATLLIGYGQTMKVTVVT